MGTRSLIAVILNGTHKVAQYSQFDGYPSGQGVGCLEFLWKNLNVNFRNKVEALSFYTEKELENLDDRIELDGETGSDILNLIASGRVTKLGDCYENAKNSLWCEWAYVIDLDNNTFEVYKGFNESPLAPSDRFYSDGYKYKTYYPVRLVKSWPLNNLPTTDQFLDFFTSDEEE